MERQSERQQSVLRRKAEEAAAANRRLKEALGKQKLAQEERLRKQETTDASGVGNRIRVCLRANPMLCFLQTCMHSLKRVYIAHVCKFSDSE